MMRSIFIGGILSLSLTNLSYAQSNPPLIKTPFSYWVSVSTKDKNHELLLNRKDSTETIQLLAYEHFKGTFQPKLQLLELYQAQKVVGQDQLLAKHRPEVSLRSENFNGQKGTGKWIEDKTSYECLISSFEGLPNNLFLTKLVEEFPTLVAKTSADTLFLNQAPKGYPTQHLLTHTLTLRNYVANTLVRMEVQTDYDNPNKNRKMARPTPQTVPEPIENVPVRNSTQQIGFQIIPHQAQPTILVYYFTQNKTFRYIDDEVSAYTFSLKAKVMTFHRKKWQTSAEEVLMSGDNTGISKNHSFRATADNLSISWISSPPSTSKYPSRPEQTTSTWKWTGTKFQKF